MPPAGGYQKPGHPAPVSGPGALSRRTDGGPAQAMRDLPDAKYGENAQYRDIQAGAPMAAAPSPVPSGGGATSPASSPLDASPPTPLTSPSTMPGQPVTNGASAGPGAMSMVLPQTNEFDTALAVVQRAASTGGSQAAALLARISKGL